MSANYLVAACPVCDAFACAEHQPEPSTFTVTVTDASLETLHTETGGVGPAYIFTAKELGLPEREKK